LYSSYNKYSFVICLFEASKQERRKKKEKRKKRKRKREKGAARRKRSLLLPSSLVILPAVDVAVAFERESFRGKERKREREEGVREGESFFLSFLSFKAEKKKRGKKKL
jgi:hypothetical protein